MKKWLLAAAFIAVCSPIFAQNIYNASRRYQGEISAGYALGLGDAPGRGVAQTVHGIRFSPYFFAGLGAGIIYQNFENPQYGDETILYMPAFVNSKAYYPIADKLAVFVSLDLGASIDINYNQGDCNFYTTAGPGISYGEDRAVEFSVRYLNQGSGSDAILFNLGFRF